ncbi:MAG: carboxypeptidase regulatory-like domain-containing protein [Oscillospiraceae bacterium]|nr:carboxypeptidase regulatory-like domain-containing protein [Oscillospiraceae bacterium]MCD7768330.1 carboxypeptidase regulatory-like domain-containing protein [Oscillospiraceae bacterium]MCD7786216.1 carboxypeptidase regulatory-like domain-containing protein [Oscillospiraceae bacterium]MCD8255688.1 carboxypeptidase regulatory-like domain-containing protein [Oscillospiraceae bacterium]MCD8358170.1 carboxypeptidase regulatory-like domain-containing protein [Oscillospiraceae bacterium]
MGKILLIDITRCNGCYSCQISCKDEHVDNEWMPYAKPQPNTGHFWYKITETVQGTVPKVRVHYMHEVCQHCDNAPCIAAAKDGAVYKRPDGIVIIDPEKAKGQKELVESCPYHAIYWNDVLDIPQKCTMCAHLLDNEGWTEPRCVQACPTDALIFGEEEELKDRLGDFEQLHPEYGTGPRVYYKGLLNKYFIAGEVYDPDADECLEGATVTLLDSTGAAVKTVKTDVFGDFWFERNEPGEYSIKIEMDGYTARAMDSIDATTKDVNVGSLELKKA